jgi:hypothetical protein
MVRYEFFIESEFTVRHLRTAVGVIPCRVIAFWINLIWNTYCDSSRQMTYLRYNKLCDRVIKRYPQIFVDKPTYSMI